MSKKILTKEEIEVLVKDGLRQILEGCEDARAEGLPNFKGPYNPAPQSSSELAETLKLLTTFVGYFKGKLALAQSDPELRETARHELAELKLTPHDIEPASLNRLIRQLGKSRIKFFETELARLQGDYDNAYDAGSMSNQVAFHAPASSMAPLLSDVCNEWIAEKRLNSKASTIKDYQGYIPIIMKALPDVPIDKLGRADFVSGIEKLSSMTSAHGQQFSARSTEKYANGMAMVMNYAKRAGYVDINRCPALKKSKQTEKGWVPFTDEELRMFFGLPELTDPAKLLLKPHFRLLPLISIYTGLRLNEVCQLKLHDVVQADDVLCIAVNDDGDKELKSAGSKRAVPVHPKLAPVLQEMIAQRLAEELDGLFPGLKSAAVSKAMNRLVRKVSKGAVFHSFRKRFAAALLETGCSKSMIAALLGHADELPTTSIYSGAYPVEQLSAAVARIDYRHLMV